MSVEETLVVVAETLDMAVPILAPAFHTRIQLEYDWNAAHMGTFLVKRFVDNVVQEETRAFWSEIVCVILGYQYDYQDLPVYTYGEWVSKQLWDKAAIQSLWF